MELLVFVLTILSLWGSFRWAKRSPLGIAAGAAEVLGLLAVAWFSRVVEGDPIERLLSIWLAASVGGWGYLVWEGIQKGQFLLQDFKQGHALNHTLQLIGPALSLDMITNSQRQLHGILSYAPSGQALINTPGEYMEVSVRFIRESGQPRTLISVSSPRIPYELSISPTQKHEALNQAWFPGKQNTGAEFPLLWEPYERLFGSLEECLGHLPCGLFVEGIERDVLPLMNAETRDFIDALARYGRLTISTRQVALALPHYEQNHELIQARYQAVLHLAHLLSLTDDQRNQRLAGMLKDDTDKRLQVRCLELLQHFAPQSELTTTQSRWAIYQVSPHLRLVGATFLQQESIPVLQALFEDITHPTNLRKCVLRALLDKLEVQEEQKLCEQVWQSQDEDDCKVILHHMETHQHPATLDFLCHLLDTMSWSLSSSLELTILETLGELATSQTFVSSGAEAHALRSLGIPQYDRILAAALRMLGLWGSHAALLPLHQARRICTSDTQRAWLDRCKEQIQERMGPVDAGGLTLLPEDEDDEGKLSMLSSTDGQVSIVPTQIKIHLVRQVSAVPTQPQANLIQKKS